jgi:hypothetical protein
MAPPSPKPSVRREPACRCQVAASPSSTGNTAVPSAPSASTRAPFSSATAATSRMNSRCSRCAFVTTATVGLAMAARRAISPGWFMPSSTTATACTPSRRRSSVSGRPMSLLKLPSVASARSPCQARRMEATICVVVVLPLLPPTATSGNAAKRARQAAPSAPSASRASATSSPARSASAMPRSASAATAPAAFASARNSAPSKRSPRKATKRSPSRSVRVSLCTRAIGVAGSPRRRDPGSRACSWPSVAIGAAPLRVRSAARACSTSENGAVVPAISCVVSCPLPATRTTSSAAARATARAIASARSTTGLDPLARRDLDAGQDLGDDRFRRFTTRVVARHDDAVGEARRDGAHPRPLGRVAIAAAPEHAPERAAAGAGEGPQRDERLLERVGRVRVVDDDIRRADVPRAIGDALHPPRHGAETGAGAGGVLERDAQRAQGSDDAQHVGDVVAADLGAADEGPARRRRRGGEVGRVAFDDRERQALRRLDDVGGDQSRGACRVEGGRPQRGSGRGDPCRERRAERVVDVQHRRTEAGPVEEARLGGPVGLHRAVRVEVVLGQVREDGDGDHRAVEPVLGEADRGGLDGTGGVALADEPGQRRLQRRRVGRRQAGGDHAAPVVGHAQRADRAASLPEAAERLGDPPAGRGLAVGAGDGDDGEFGAGSAEEDGGDRPGGLLQAGERREPRTFIEGERIGAFGLDQAGGRARLERGGDEASGVVGRTGPGEQRVAAAEPSAVGDERAGAACLQPGAGGLGRGEPLQPGAHWKLSVAAGRSRRTMPCFTSRSGATPRMRIACVTTSLKTGAATAPP